jgi:hypothetical protein
MAIKPVRLTNPFITLGDTTPVDFECFSNGIHLTGEENDDLATFCDPQGYEYTLSLDLKMSLGAGSLDAAWDTLGGPGTVVPFEFAYTNAVASADNPHWTGEVRLAAIPIVDAGINEPTSFTVDMDIIGDITRDDGTVQTVIGSSSHTHMTSSSPNTVEETVAA